LCAGKNNNFAYWTGTRWFFLKNKNNFCFDKIDCNKPFYVIFNDFLEITETNNDFFDLRLKDICLDSKNNFIVTSDVQKNNKFNFLNNQDSTSLSEEICLCPQTGFCYTFIGTLIRTGSGCGFCKDKKQPKCWYSIATVGGGTIKTTQYSDPFIKSIYIPYPSKNLLDGLSVQVAIQTTLCGSLCVAEISAKIISSCPFCHFNNNHYSKNFRHSAFYQKSLIERRRQNRSDLNKKKLKRFF
jgi:hypothetical protein